MMQNPSRLFAGGPSRHLSRLFRAIDVGALVLLGWISRTFGLGRNERHEDDI